MEGSKIISITDGKADKIALQILRDGGVISVPTDTVYGIVCEVYNPKAIERIYEIKGRDFSKGLPILIGEISQLDNIAMPLNIHAQKLAQHFWPGALTLIVPRRSNLPHQLSSFPTIGVRMPNHAWLLNFLLKSGPLASTSANISGNPEAHSSLEVVEQLAGNLDLIMDGGTSSHSIPSTIVDCSGPDIKILREGPISSDLIQRLGC